MSALAIYLERQGITTVVIGLVRLHLEKIKPPRALWVPFELGRPLGAYTASGDFQKQVLRSALALLDNSDGPVIVEDFQLEDPGAAADPEWSPPELSDVNLSGTRQSESGDTETISLQDELQMLLPAWKQAQSKLGGTLVGLSGLAIEQSADYLQSFSTNQPVKNPDDSLSDLLRMRFCADDIKTFYAEAALARGRPNSQQIGQWFWQNTAAASVLRQIRAGNLQHSSSTRATVCGNLLVPRTFL